MQLTRPTSPTRIVTVQIQYRMGRGKSQSFTVYNVDVKKLKEFLKKSVAKGSSNGRN